MSGSIVIGYLAVGLIVSEMANLGHKRKYGRPLPRGIYAAGMVFWPIMMMVGSRK